MSDFGFRVYISEHMDFIRLRDLDHIHGKNDGGQRRKGQGIDYNIKFFKNRLFLKSELEHSRMI